MGRILPESWRNALAGLQNVLLPASCLLCGGDSNAALCPECADDLPCLPPACPQCAEATTHGERCGRCLHTPPHFDAAVALWRYDFPIDRLIHAFKYRGELALGGWFAERLADRLQQCAFDGIVPLPLHPLRLRQRGFNQAVEVARPLGRRLGIPVYLDLCQRRRPTAPQADLPHKERAANVRGAFECASDLNGRHLLLIDDVMTTGATLDECARTLKLHGAARVSVAVVARALRNG